MLDELQNIYGNNLQAVVVEKDGIIKYFNEAAARIMPKIKTARLQELFPAELTEHNAEQFIGEAEVDGKNMIVNVTALDECRIFAITSIHPQKQGDLTNIFDAVTCELNNKLSVLKMSSDLLLPFFENLGNPKLEQYASTLYHSYYNIQRITNNLSDLSAILKNNLPLQRISFDLISSCKELANSVYQLVSNLGVEIRFESKLDNLIIYADKPQLDKMILNILSNSLKNTPAGGTIVLSIVHTGDRFILTVSDTGKGMPPDVLLSIWNRYSPAREHCDLPVGIGLGLPIIYAVVKQHGGNVLLESKENIGTSVVVSIPITEPDATNKTFIVEPKNYDMQQLLTELSGVITNEKYTQKYMD